MSSITFPTERRTSVHEDGLYSSPFDASSSFQMNPLSAHPPRTPRTSIIATGTTTEIYTGHGIYETKSETEEVLEIEGSDVDEEQVEKAKLAEARVSKEEVWRDLFLTSNGRDKGFKLIQYTIKLYLLFHKKFSVSWLLRQPTRPLWEAGLVKRLESTASGLSFSRKLLLLFNWLGPLTAVRAQQSTSFSSGLPMEKGKQAPHTFLQSLLYAPPPVLLELVNAISDDAATLSKLGLLGKRIGSVAERFSDWCWFLATLFGLIENGLERQVLTTQQQEVESRMYKESMTGATSKSTPRNTKIDETELRRLQKQDYWLQVTRAKLCMDLIFVSYDIFKIKRLKPWVQTSVGLISAILSSMKLYYKQRTVISKASSSS